MDGRINTLQLQTPCISLDRERKYIHIIERERTNQCKYSLRFGVLGLGASGSTITLIISKKQNPQNQNNTIHTYIKKKKKKKNIQEYRRYEDHRHQFQP